MHRGEKEVLQKCLIRWFSVFYCSHLRIFNDVLRFHGINERISKKNYEELIQFYFSLIQNCDTRQLPEPHSAVHEL